jgi:hypothetical protein
VTSQKRCFLKRKTPLPAEGEAFANLHVVHAFKVPCISTEKITFSMVYHIRSDGDCFVATENSKTNNKEHMFAFIEGITSEQIGHLLLGQLNHWQDDVTDCLDRSSGITPGLLTAAVLAYHGYVVAREITGLFTELQKFDDTLSKTIDELENDTNGSGDAATIKIQVLNKRLIEINRKLTGTRSIMHFLAESADLLVNGIIPFDDYVTGRFQTLEKSFHELDSYKERIRDHDKLMMVSKSMFQYKTDIESLQQHININVGMVSCHRKLFWRHDGLSLIYSF